ncbi:hypothetical protein TNIN_311131 [Trichonephila inaurata madagascariensis]|uniref:Uncharacterized protein n=1 Tax=Trichonephila inaurata madagascariensis TaxID=2747483 RepID=A0A8X7BRF5_9ARAC|nr:hypothetical protein TNIN_311131 [Trichonephila inaurata madagascariensis]
MTAKLEPNAKYSPSSNHRNHHYEYTPPQQMHDAHHATPLRPTNRMYTTSDLELLHHHIPISTHTEPSRNRGGQFAGPCMDHASNMCTSMQTFGYKYESIVCIYSI